MSTYRAELRHAGGPPRVCDTCGYGFAGLQARDGERCPRTWVGCTGTCRVPWREKAKS